MTYPSQPGYPTPQYGGQSQPPQQQNNLWLIGGTVLVVLIVIMTVILLVVQSTQGSNSSDGGDGGQTGGETGGGTGGETGDDGGGTETSDPAATEFKSEACAEFDLSAVEEAVSDRVDVGAGSASASSYDSFDSVSCNFYTESDFNTVLLSFYDYESAEDVIWSIDYDDDIYGTDADYEMTEYTEFGDDGNVYTNISDPSYQTTNLHVALGSLEVKVSVSYDSTKVDAEAVLVALEDLLMQSDALFADYK